MNFARLKLEVRDVVTFLVVATCLQAAHVAYVLTGGSRRISTFVPDDGFYYLRLARNFSVTGHWTLDGVAPATGFHLLWGYFWATVFWMAPHIDLPQIFVVGFAVSLLCYLLSAIALCALVSQWCGRPAM